MTIDMTCWHGRTDDEDGDSGSRFHQKILPADTANQPGIVLLGFATDEGVSRNQGRVGAYTAPTEIRKALANLPWHHTLPIYDGGDRTCDDHDLAKAQKTVANDVSDSLRQHHFPFVIGGGHEIAWASFQGLANHMLQKGTHPAPKIGIINFDAHFDLRTPSSTALTGSSGTSFAQIAEWCKSRDWPFLYSCLGISRSSNTLALFNKAHALSVLTIEDTEMSPDNLPLVKSRLQHFIEQCDCLYLTIDIDVFPASVAPGANAPAVHGVSYPIVEHLLKDILSAKDREGNQKVKIADIAEVNPRYDIDNQTARLAARLIWTITRSVTTSNVSASLNSPSFSNAMDKNSLSNWNT